MTREQRLDQAVRRVTGPSLRGHIVAGTLGKWPFTIKRIREEYAILTQHRVRPGRATQ